jgi:Flp pilus assembly protein protease CpaA
MTLLATYGVVLYATLASVWDVRVRRIPNWLSFSALALAFVVAHCDGGIGLAAAGAGAGLGIAAFLGPFALRAVGAGDVKFAAVVGAWLGPHLGLNALILGSATGLFVALGFAAAAGRAGRAVSAAANVVWMAAATMSLATLPPADPDQQRLAPIPYALPLAGGVFGTLLLDRLGCLPL